MRYLPWLLLLPVVAVGAANRQALDVVYLNLGDDPRHAAFSGYANIVLRPAADPYAGAETAAQEARIVARALGVRLELERIQVPDVGAMIETIRTRHAAGARLFLLDAPGDIVAAVARATRGMELLLFNVTAPDDALRGSDCAPQLLHTYPSRAMLNDALAQFAVAQGWQEILVLHGPAAADRQQTEAFRDAAARFGLEVSAVRAFTQGNDPRRRERHNVGLLTQGDYDAVYVADAALGLGRFLPYRTKRPRPVFGDVGLQADAWHWATERYGSPQLNQRFERLAERRMNGKDWAAWAAVRAIVDALRVAKSARFDDIVRVLRSDDLALDSYKGSPASFRSWSGQLRQPVVLHTDNAALAYAPFAGFLHPAHRLDTLGVDRAQSECGAN